MKIFIILFICFLLSQSKFVFAQGCCSVFIPTLSTTETSVINSGLLRSSLSYLYTNTSSFYFGKNKTTDILSRKASLNNISLNLDIGLPHNFNLAFFLPFNSLYRKSTFNGNDIEYSNKGIGDVSLFIKHSPFNNVFTSPIELIFAGGIKFPTGDFLTEKDGVQLPIDIQPGTGSLDFIFWILASFVLFDDVSLTQSVFYKLSGSNSKGFDIANEFISNSGLYYSLSKIFTLSSLGRLQIRGYDYLESQIVVNSGRILLEWIPGLIIKLDNSTLRSYFCFPVFVKVNGSQLTPTWRLGLEFSYQIHLF